MPSGRVVTFLPLRSEVSRSNRVSVFLFSIFFFRKARYKLKAKLMLFAFCVHERSFHIVLTVHMFNADARKRIFFGYKKRI